MDYQEDIQRYQIPRQLLSLDMITNIQKRLNEYKANIEYIVQFVVKSQKHFENHLNAIKDMADSFSQNPNQKYIMNANSNFGRYSLNNQPVFQQIVNVFKEAIFEILELNPAFAKDSIEFIEQMNKELDEIQLNQCKIAKESILIYKEHEKEFQNQFKNYKQQSKETLKKIEEYNDCLNDPKLHYNPKEKQMKWEKLEKEYSLLGQKENVFFDTLELIQTNKKALGINLQELMQKNQKSLMEIIRIFLLYIMKSSASFVLFFFFYSNYLHKQLEKNSKFQWNPEIIPPPLSYSSKSQPFDSQNKFPNFLYSNYNLTDHQLVEFSDYAKIYIHDIEKQSQARQNEVVLSLKFLESLRDYLEGCAKGLKELQAKFDLKTKQNIAQLMGKEVSLQINILQNNIEIASSQITKHSKIVNAQYEKIKTHLQNLKECHQRVFTGLNKSLFDHNRIRDEFKIVLLYQSQYQYQSAYSSAPSQRNYQPPQYVNDHYRMSPQSSINSQNQVNQPNFQIIKKKIVDHLPVLQECIIFFLNDYEKTNIKELSAIREGLKKLVVQIENSCKEMVDEFEKQEQNKRNFESGHLIGNAGFQPSIQVDESSIKLFVQDLLRKDEVYKLLYSDMDQDVQNLQVDFPRQTYFNHNLIDSLEPPSRYNQISKFNRRPSLFDFQDQEENESFLSFQSNSEEEKTAKNDNLYENGYQTYGNNQIQNQNGSSYQINSQGQTSQKFQKLHSQDSLQINKTPSQARKQELQQHEEFIKKRIQWIEGEELKHHFSCAFAQSINLQGRIYITNKRLIFQSYFNGNNLFFNETILEIPKGDILQIHKKKNMLLFDNAIQIDVVKGSLLFTQFIYRDDAYNAILKVLQPVNMVSQASPQRRIQNQEEEKKFVYQTPNKSVQSKSQTSIQEDRDDPSNEKVQQQLIQRKQNIDSLIKQNDTFKFELCDVILKGENITIRDVFQACLGDFQYQNPTTNTVYENFFYYYIENVMKCWNIQIEKWSPPPPQYFQQQNYPFSEENEKKKEKVQDWIEISQRQVTYDKTIPLSGMPFLPKFCKVSEKQKIIFISPDELIFELEAQSSGAPMTDTFYHFIRNTFVQLTPDTVSYKVQMDVRFLKSNWFSGTIDSQSQKEGVKSTQEIYKSFQERLTQFLQDKNEKRRNLNAKSEVNDDSDKKSTISAKQKSPAKDFSHQIRIRQQQILESIDPYDKYKHDIIDLKFSDPVNGLKVNEVFKVIFDDTISYQGFSDLYEYLKIKKFNDKNYQASKFLPPVPSFIHEASASEEENLQKIISSPHYSEREIKFTHPLPPSNIPFMPKECQVREVLKAYYVSDQMLILNIEAFTSGIPKGDSFSVRVRYQFEQIDPFTVQLQQKSYLHFMQSTFLQGQIESNTIEQQRISAKVIIPFFEQIVSQYISNKQQVNLSKQIASQSSSPIKQSDTQKKQNLKAEIENRKRRILSSIEPNEKYKHQLIDYTFNYQNQPINLQQIFNFFFSDSLKFREFSDFQEYIKRGKMGDYDYKSTMFSPPIPNYFQLKSQRLDEDLIACPEYSEREVRLTHPLPPSNIPFMPKTCQVREVTRVYWVSNDTIVVNLEAFTSGIPKGDSFTVRVRSIFTQIDKENIHFSQFSYVHFLESTFLQGKIENGTIEQSHIAVKNCVLPAYQEAFQMYAQQYLTNNQIDFFQSGLNFKQIKSDNIKIQSIDLQDDLNEIYSQTDAGSIILRSPTFRRNNSQSSRRNSKKLSKPTNTADQNDQITQLNKNISDMNDKIKIIIIGFVLIYLSTLLFILILK
ncbi:hypothetical protein ABPG74_007177 [Tetrahymena malaccensis]